MYWNEASGPLIVVRWLLPAKVNDKALRRQPADLDLDALGARALHDRRGDGAGHLGCGFCL